MKGSVKIMKLKGQPELQIVKTSKPELIPRQPADYFVNTSVRPYLVSTRDEALIYDMVKLTNPKAEDITWRRLNSHLQIVDTFGIL